MQGYEIKKWMGGIGSANDVDIGGRGSAKFFSNCDIRKLNDTLSAGQALKEEGEFGVSHSQSSSISASASQSPSSSGSASQSPSSSASASPSPSAGVFSVYEGLVIAWVEATDGNLYGFDNVGHIYRRYSDGYTRMVYTDADGATKGAVEKPSDDGKTYLQWATGTSVKQKPLPGAGDWSDVTEIADNLTGTDWHTMKQVGGANYIANGSKMALVGYDDSWT